MNAECCLRLRLICFPPPVLQFWIHDGKFLMNTWCLYCFVLIPFMWLDLLECNLLPDRLTKAPPGAGRNLRA